MPHKTPTLVVDLDAIVPSGCNRATFSNALIDKMNECKENGMDVIIQSNHTRRATNLCIKNLSDSYALNEEGMTSLSYKELEEENYNEGFWSTFLEKSSLSNEDIVFVTGSENAYANAVGEQIKSLNISGFKQADAAVLQIQNFIQQKIKPSN